MLTKIFNPVSSVFYSWGNGIREVYMEKIGGDKTLEELKKENENLRLEKQKLLKENAELKILVKENESLKKELGFKKERGYNTVSARVVSRDLLLPDTLVIDKGTADGLRDGLPVVADEGVIVGKIIKAGEESSTALLLTNTQSKLAVMSLDNQEINGILRGEHGLSLRMDMIPKNKAINRGEIIVTSGIESNVPPGLLVGVIEQVTNLSGELFQSASLSPLVNYHNIKFVLVILP